MKPPEARPPRHVGGRVFSLAASLGRIGYAAAGAGSTRIVQGEPPFALIVGNSAQVSLEFDGKPINLATHTKGSVARLTLP